MWEQKSLPLLNHIHKNMKNLSAIASEIPFSEMEGIKTGNITDEIAGTGLTLFHFPHGARAAVDVSGGGPASRGTNVLDLARNDTPLDALVFGGGSAFGLEAATGVERYLEEKGIGLNTGAATVPIVVQSDIYDLSYGKSDVRPDAAMGYRACQDAFYGGIPQSGSVGAGTGATIGKACGMKQSQKSGIGYAAYRIGNIKVGACVVVNSYGDIFDSGVKIAGMTTPDRKGFSSAEDALYGTVHSGNLFTDGQNTTIGVVFVNADFTREGLYKIAQMTRNAYARCIRPVGTMADGDTIYAVAAGKSLVRADINVVGTLASRAMEAAILNAVKTSRMADSQFLENL